jgi:hypothetical protein
MTMPTFANAQALIITYLRGALASRNDAVLSGLIIGASVPPSRAIGSSPLLVVRRSGGPAKTPVQDRPRLDFLCWAATEYKATAIANIIRSLLLYDLPGQVIDGHTVYKPAEFAGPSSYPDPAGSAVPVVMMTLEIPIRVI